MAASGGNYVMDGFIMFLDYLATFDHVYLVTVSKVRLIIFFKMKYELLIPFIA